MVTFTNIPIQDMVMVVTDPPIGRVEARGRGSWEGIDIDHFEGMPNTRATREAMIEALRHQIDPSIQRFDPDYGEVVAQVMGVPPPFLESLTTTRKEMAETTTTVEPTVQPVIPVPIEGRCNVDYTNLPPPKYLKEELEYLAGYFIVQSEDGTFGYYPIKYHAGKQGNFYRIRTSPPFLVNGMVCIEDAFISVPISDLVRKHVNTTRIISRRETKGSSSKKSKATVGLERNTNESGLVEMDESEINKAVDMAMQEQANALLYLEDSKEEW